MSDCGCKVFSLDGRTQKPKPKNTKGPGYTAIYNEIALQGQMINDLIQETTNTREALKEFIAPIVFEEDGAGSLTLIFRDVTAEEVRKILTGALKDNNKLYSMMYSTNDESEQNNG